MTTAHHPRKRFGQNFLKDPGVIENIIKLIHPKKNENLLEIGPGLGALTFPILDQVAHLTVIEIDHDLIHKLQKKWPEPQLTIVSADVLNVDFSHYGQRLRIIGNLPYNISTPLLFHLAQFRAQIQDLHFMLQKEVIDRMIANPGTTAFGRLSVMLQYWFTMEKLLEVPAEAFHPKPKVESAIIRMVPKLTIPSAINESELSRLVKAAFSQRRKTLRNTLKGTINPVLFSQAEIDSGLRAEDLSVSDYVRLANLLTTSQNRN